MVVGIGASAGGVRGGGADRAADGLVLVAAVASVAVVVVVVVVVGVVVVRFRSIVVLAKVVGAMGKIWLGPPKP